MKTLSSNYAKNVEILKENLKRGMSAAMANKAIDGMETQFKQAGLYKEEEEEFINQMRASVINHFTRIHVEVA